MIKPTYVQMRQYENEYTYIPVCKEVLADDITPILMLRKLAALDEQYFYWKVLRVAVPEDILFWASVQSSLSPAKAEP